MKHAVRQDAAFSLVEVVLALGVAAFALIAVMGMLPVGIKIQQASVNQTKANAVMSQCVDFLRADVRLPAGQAKKAEGGWENLNGHWQSVAVPDTLFFTIDAKENGYASGSAPPAPAGAVYRATITYLFPPTATTNFAACCRWCPPANCLAARLAPG